MKKTIILSLLVCCLNMIKAQNNALHFDGIDDEVSLAYDASLDFSPTDIFTIELWFKTTANTAVLYSNHVDLAPFIGHEVAIVNGKAVFEMVNDHITSAFRIETQANYNDGNWHHIAVVYNGSPNPTLVTFLVDGVIQTMNATHNNLTGLTSSSNAPHIGSRNNTAYFTNGFIDELRIWKRALCIDEILARKNCELNGNEPMLAGYYNFNMGQAWGNNATLTALPDLTLANNTGTLSGFALTGITSNYSAPPPGITGTCSAFSVPISISGPTITCRNVPINLTASGASNYTWQPGNVTGTVVNLLTQSNTIYTVTGIVANGCPGMATLLVRVVSDCTNIESYSPSVLEVNIYPNPSQDYVIVEGGDSDCKIELYNSVGQLIICPIDSGDKIRMNVSDLEKGIYFIRVTSDNHGISRIIYKN